MRYFQVKAGIHKDGAEVYTKGNIVQSTDDLVKKFRNKFFEIPAPMLAEQLPKSTKQKPAIHNSSPTVKKQAKTKMVKEEKPQTPLSLPTVGKEEAVSKEVSVVGAGEEEVSKIGGIDFTIFGKEITKKFPNAKPLECRVFTKDGKRTIVDKNDGEILVGDLKTHAEVRESLVDLTATDDDAKPE